MSINSDVPGFGADTIAAQMRIGDEREKQLGDLAKHVLEKGSFEGAEWLPLSERGRVTAKVIAELILDGNAGGTNRATLARGISTELNAQLGPVVDTNVEGKTEVVGTLCSSLHNRTLPEKTS